MECAVWFTARISKSGRVRESRKTARPTGISYGLNERGRRRDVPIRPKPFIPTAGNGG